MGHLKKPIIIFSAIVAVILLLAGIAAFFIGPRVKEIAISQINSNLTVPVQVDDIRFSFLRKFPYASIDFIGIKTQGIKMDGVSKPLLEAKHVFLMFNLFDVFSDDLQMKKIEIHDASLFLYTDRTGSNNYDVFKKNNSSKNHFSVELGEVLLDEVNVHYLSRYSQREFYLLSKKSNLTGKFSDDIYDLNAEGNFYAEKIIFDNINYLDHKDTELKLSLHIDNKRRIYEISNASLKIAELKLDVDGRFNDTNDGTYMDLNVKSKDAGLKELLSLIPGVYTEKLKQYHYDGNIYFNMRVNGISGKTLYPLVTADFGTANASLTPVSSDYALRKIKFKGSFSNRISVKNPVSRLQFSNFEALLEGQPVRASLILENLADPYIDLVAHSRVNLEVLSRFYMPDTLQSISGEAQVDAQIRGRASDKSGWNSDGTVIAKNVSFRIKGKDVDFSGFNGKFDLEGNQLTVNDFHGNAAGSDFLINGTFMNVYSYLLSKNEAVNCNISLSSKNLDLNELLEDKLHTTSKDTIYNLDFSPRINLILRANIGMLTFRKFEAWQLKGTFSLQNKVLSTTDLTLKAFEGNVQLEGSINASRTDSILIAADADVKNLNINTLFYQLGNFGQNVILDKNVNGRMTASIQFISAWGKNLHCNFDKIYVRSSLTIENGELNDFEPMLALSRYLKGADLRKIKFSTLQNQIEIKNQTIYIPTMQIRSSAMDLTASGTHTFGNIVDYKLQLLLSQLTGKKVKEQNTEFGTIEDDGLGRFKIFLSMKGPLSNPKITYDKKGVEEKITHDIRQEKQNLKGILKEEFGWFKKDTVKTTPRQQPKKPELELDTDEN